MSVKMKWMLGIGVLGLSLPVMANQDFISCQDLAPYVGVDVKWNNMQFKKAAGGNLVQKKYPQGNLFGGVKFNDCLGFELGYESTTKKSKTGTTAVLDNFFGQVNKTRSSVNSTTKTKISGFHINVLGFYPICEEYCLSLFGSLGLAQLKLKSHLDFSVPRFGPEVDSRDFSKRKLVPRVTLGIQHMLCQNIGVRATLGWERTSAFKKIYSKTVDSPLFMNPKDSKSIGLGVFYSF